MGTYVRVCDSTFLHGWSRLIITNRGWKARPAESFKGPFGPTNTSSPMLFIGNTADPVSSLGNAKKMSKYYPGSVVLTVDTIGVSRLFPRPNLGSLPAD
jgi:hypothetical protein